MDSHGADLHQVFARQPADAAYCYFDGVVLAGHSRNGGPVAVGVAAVRQPVRLPLRPAVPQLRRAGPGLPATTGPRPATCSSRAFWRASSAASAASTWPWPPRRRPASPTTTAASISCSPSCPAMSLEPPHSASKPQEINLGIAQGRRGSPLRPAPGKPGHAAALRLGHLRRLRLAGPRRRRRRAAEALPVRHRDDASRSTSSGKRLRAGNKPLEGQLVVESNGGTFIVTSGPRCRSSRSPTASWPGPRARGRSPRRPRPAPRRRPPSSRTAAVAEWYKSNGWTYPVQGPAASGLGAVQQFFEALGLTTPPKVEISERSVNLSGNAGDSSRHASKSRRRRNGRSTPTAPATTLAGGRPGQAQRPRRHHPARRAARARPSPARR